MSEDLTVPKKGLGANRVLLINPPRQNTFRMEKTRAITASIGEYPPLGLLSIAAYLKTNFPGEIEVKVIDSAVHKLTYAQLEQKIIAFMPDIVGITTFTPAMIDVVLTSRLVKSVNPHAVIVLGGHHVDCYPHQVLEEPSVDFIIRGEGEQSFFELVNNLVENKALDKIKGIGFRDKGSVYINENRGYIDDLDSLPVIDRSMIDNYAYRCALGSQNVVATIISSRGCPYQCIFCYSPQKTYRTRSTGNILQELQQITALGIREIFFYDDLFNLNTQRVIDISAAILKARLPITWSFRARVNMITDELLGIAKKSGCERIHYGLETGSDQFLKKINKEVCVADIRNAVALTKKNKILAVGSFIIGFPGEGREHIYNTFKFARELDLDYVQFGFLTAYPKTKLYSDCLANGLIKEDFWLKFAKDPLGYQKQYIPQICTDLFSEKELSLLVNAGYRLFYLRPGFILRSLLRTRSFRELFNKVHGAIVLLLEFMREGKNTG